MRGRGKSCEGWELDWPCRGIAYIEYTVSVPSSHLLPSSPTWALGGATLACGVRGGGTQFRRRDRNSGTLCILQYLYGWPYYFFKGQERLVLKCGLLAPSASVDYWPWFKPTPGMRHWPNYSNSHRLRYNKKMSTLAPFLKNPRHRERLSGK